MEQSSHLHLHKPSTPVLVGSGIAGGLILAPYALPFFGIGSATTAARIAGQCAGNGAMGSGLAGFINETLSEIPVIGPELATSGWTGAIASGVIGLGGALLGNYISRHYDKAGHIPWGKVIRYATLATSILIALPSILSGISMGIAFLASLEGGVAGAAAASAALGAMEHTLGFMGASSMAATTASTAGIFAHLFTCGAATLPVIGSMFVGNNKPTAHAMPAADDGRYGVKLVSSDVPRAGVPCRLAFQVVDTQTGAVVGEPELQRIHTKKLHTMIVDNSLSDYHHLHPEYDPASKQFTCEFTPKTAQAYMAWHDFTPRGEAASRYVRTVLPHGPVRTVPPLIMPNSRVQAGGLTAHIETDGPLRAGEPAMISVTLKDAAGRVVTNLEPIMEEYAHLVGFTQDGADFIHSHPTSGSPKNEASRGNGALQFHVVPPKAGGSKFFLQVKRDGQDITLPFGAIALPSPGFQGRISAPAQHHHAMAMG